MHDLYRIEKCVVVGPYTLSLQFDDGLVRVINFEPILHGELFGPLRDQALFAQVRVDDEAHTIVWPNDADFDPETLHNWPDYVDELTAAARRWQTHPVSYS
ncbi:MAG: DUF2442 domain-containing protein [Caldilineaceae bacterium]|nr:DUF2442 domain-containing protein [Caldilineaceae bacterium]